MIDFFTAKRELSKVKQIEAVYGGKWKYDGWCTWNCDDGKRYVVRCSPGVDQWDNEDGPSQYWLYGDEHPARLFFPIYTKPR